MSGRVNLGAESDFRDRTGLARLLSLPVYRAGSSTGASTQKSLVAVASTGLFPQPLWISARRETNLSILVNAGRGCQGLVWYFEQ
jgi:hypothetical protein